MDASALVPMLTAALAPYLPYLLKAGEEAAEGAISKFGADSWDWARALWKKLLQAASDSTEVISAARNVAAAAPDEAEDAQAAFRFQLRRLLLAHPELAANLDAERERLQAQVQMIVSGTRAVGVASMHGGYVHTGDVVSGGPKFPREED